MTNQETIANLNMIRIAFVEPVTKEQRKLIDDTFEMAIKALEQEQKIGHWKWGVDCRGTYYCKCSECGIGMGHTEYDYCPNCGARMVEPQERE